MRPNWAGWKARLSGALAGPGVGTAAWGLVFLLLAGALVGHSARSRGEVAGLEARAAGLDREIREMRRRNQDLRDEVKALETDPVYVESVLRRWKRVGEGERPVE